jgi:hypothetical protein
VTLADGQRVPFEADAICQALFAATEELGRPDAFLARELADAVVHFLAQENDDEAPSTERLAELIVKVVRELGQPELAHCFAQRRRGTPVSDPRLRFEVAANLEPEEIASVCLREYSRQVIFSPDLRAASQNLLLLGGLDAPTTIHAICVDGQAATRDLQALRTEMYEAAQLARDYVILDSPEWLAAAVPTSFPSAWLCQILFEMAPLLRRPTVVNVNCMVRPAWASAAGGGPLFPATSSHLEANSAKEFFALFLKQWPSQAREGLILNWHLNAADLAVDPVPESIGSAIRLACENARVEFVFDRPRRPITLGVGVNRKHPGVFMEVSLALDQLLDRPGVDGDAARFLAKLPSLARMAVSAGAQKRKYLRRRAEGAGLARGFLLDRARLCVVPRHLEEVVRRLTGQGIDASTLALECACRIVQSLAGSLAEAGRLAHLDTGLEVNLCGDAAQPAQQQLYAAGKLHAISGQGTASVYFPEETELTVDALLDLLRYAGKRTEVVGVCFRRWPSARRQTELTEHTGGAR